MDFGRGCGGRSWGGLLKEEKIGKVLKLEGKLFNIQAKDKYGGQECFLHQ